jgi:hypothetical protein
MDNHALASSAYTSDDQDILDNIDGRMQGPMSGFIKKSFGGFQYIHKDAFLGIGACPWRCVTLI